MFHTSEYFDVIILPKVLVFIEVLKCLKYLKVSLPVSLCKSMPLVRLGLTPSFLRILRRIK